MLGVLVTGGERPDCEIYLPVRDRYVLVGADSGMDFVADRGWQPDFIVGDMDSIRDPRLVDAYPNAKIFRSRRDKDETDTELGLHALWDAGADDVVVIGGGGGRLDHLLAIIALFNRVRVPKTWLTGQEVVECLEHETVIESVPGETISFFPAGDVVRISASEGLRWPLNDFTWKHGDFGVSNESVATECRVKIQSGRLLMVRRRAAATVVLS